MQKEKKAYRATRLAMILKRYNIKLGIIHQVSDINYNTFYSWLSGLRNGDLKKEHLIAIAERLREAAALIETIE